MTRKNWRTAGALSGAVLLTWACSGQAQQPRTAEKVGERIDDALRDVKQGVQDATQSLRERFAQARASVQSMGIEARIYGRIHWDKALHESMIDLEVDRAGVTTLRGTVADSLAREKAVVLARDTVGVTQVIDQLTITPLPRTTGATPAAIGP